MIKLLEECKIEINQLYQASDDSNGDYKLSLNIVYRFINKALDSEDRLDVFKALQKSYDVLEGLYDEDDSISEDEQLDTKIKKALDSNNLNEISEFEPPREDFFSVLKRAHHSDPIYKDSKRGRKFANVIVTYIISDYKNIIRFTISDDFASADRYKVAFNGHVQSLHQFIYYWVRDFYMNNSYDDKIILSFVQNLIDELTVIGTQIQQILENIIKYNNYINAKKQIEHLNEIFKNIKDNVSSIFTEIESKKK